MSNSTLVTVIVPTHNHAETLEYSVQSILNQTVSDLTVVIIGDGVTDEVQSVARSLCAVDQRVQFQDHPKTSRRGELLRDAVIRGCISQFIAYNCDDDLWFPDHIETMMLHITGHDFVHPLPILIGADGVPFFMPSNLQRPDSVRWHLNKIPRNTISLSGVMHTREAYLRLPHGWRETPVGQWTDHYMWQQFFEQDWFSAITSPKATTLKLMAQGRDDLSGQERRGDIEFWWQRLNNSMFALEWDAMVWNAVRASAVDHLLVSTSREDELIGLRRDLDNHAQQIQQVQIELDHALKRLDQSSQYNDVLRLRNSHLRGQLVAVKGSRSWKITAPLRALRRKKSA